MVGLFWVISPFIGGENLMGHSMIYFGDNLVRFPNLNFFNRHVFLASRKKHVAPKIVFFFQTKFLIFLLNLHDLSICQIPSISDIDMAYLYWVVKFFYAKPIERAIIAFVSISLLSFFSIIIIIAGDKALPLVSISSTTSHLALSQLSIRIIARVLMKLDFDFKFCLHSLWASPRTRGKKTLRSIYVAD